MLTEMCKREHFHCLCFQETHRAPLHARPNITGMTLVAERPHIKYGSAIPIRRDLKMKGLFTTHMQTSSQFRKPSSPLKPKHQKYITSHQCAPIGCTRQEVGSLHSLETTSHSLQQTYLRLLIHTT